MWVIRAEREEHRYSAFLDGVRVGHAAWVRIGEVVVVPHVYVEHAYRFAGVDTETARAICEDARERELMVLAGCPFMLGYRYQHPRFDAVLRPPTADERTLIWPLVEDAEAAEERSLAERSAAREGEA
jgi:predicted GNAT family acetyltransferase